ncbi:hypothetical protein DSL72_005187 [Monilinia vaccinii-corymbosi]|uniref:Uncharacterized protein n=1 Tax=Monilinia vaccinii-corymbosi TaxID=61207 RepID=A0A8A3PEX5_9HELO|nr:hypothetical protein DSL72_005187 [Monilinia vaccinii-corymbosi]
MEQPTSTCRMSTRCSPIVVGDNDKQSLGASKQESTTAIEDERNIDIGSDLGNETTHMEIYEDQSDSDSLYFPMSSKSTSGPRRTTVAMSIMQGHKIGLAGLDSSSRVIIHPSCMTGHAPPSWHKALAKLKETQNDFPDDLPYVITYEHNLLEAICQECGKKLNVESCSVSNITRHPNSHYHTFYVERRLRKLEAEGFKRAWNKNVEERMARLAGSSRGKIKGITAGFHREFLPIKSSIEKQLKHRRSENLKEESDPTDEPLPSKRQRVAGSFFANSLADDSQSEGTHFNEDLRSSLDFEPRPEEIARQTKEGQTTQRSTTHEDLTEKLTGKSGGNAKSVLDRVMQLENVVEESENRMSSYLEKEANDSGKECGSHPHPDVDRVRRLEEEITMLASQQSGLDRRVAQLIRTVGDLQMNDLARSNKIMMMRLAALEENYGSLVHKIMELERKG